MKRLPLLKYCLTAVCFVYATVSFAAQQDPNWDSFVKKYGRYAEKKLASKGIPGAALSIVNLGNSDYIHGVGRTKARNGQEVNVHTRFRLASVSKTFAGSLAAKLSSDGLIKLDNSVSNYLPDFIGTEYEKNLKVYHLLSHSSGLVPNAYDNLIESRMDYSDIVQKLVTVKPICEQSQLRVLLVESQSVRNSQGQLSPWDDTVSLWPLERKVCDFWQIIRQCSTNVTLWSPLQFNERVG